MIPWCFALFFWSKVIILSFVRPDNPIKVSSVKSKHSYSNKEFPPFNVINGTDYWKGVEICCSKYVDLFIDFKTESLVQSLNFEFSFPPTTMFVFASSGRKTRSESTENAGDNQNWLLVAEISYKKHFEKEKEIPRLIIVNTRKKIDYNYPIKSLRLRMINEMQTPISVLMTRFEAYVGDSSFLIRKLYVSNGIIKHYCLKAVKNDNMNANAERYTLALEECYYCMMYYIKQCSFRYELTNEFGHRFNIFGENSFYIPSSSSTSPSKAQSQAQTSQKSTLSIENEEINYANDIQSIAANSTMTDVFKVQNVFKSTLEYWSSKLYRKGTCPMVEIKIVFEKEFVVKSLLLDWVKVPHSFEVKFCLLSAHNPTSDSDEVPSKNATRTMGTESDTVKIKGSLEELECISKTYSAKSIENFHSELRKLYIKANTVYIYLHPNNNEEIGSGRKFCIFSIKRIRIFRNEIHVEPDLITVRGITSRVYNYNFFLTRLRNNDLQTLQSNTNLEMYKETEDILQDIRLHKRNVDKTLRQKEFKNLITTDLTSYYKFIKARNFLKDLLKSLDLNQKENKEIIKAVFSKKNAKQSESSSFAADMIKYTFEIMKKTHDYYSLVKEYIKFLEEVSDTRLSKAFDSIQTHFKNLENYLVASSHKFIDVLNDNYKLDTLRKIRAIAKFINKALSLKKLLNLKSYFEKINNAMIEANLFDVQDVKLRIDGTRRLFNETLANTEEEESKFFEKLWITLQNIKLLTITKQPFWVNITSDEKNKLGHDEVVCQEFHIIKNFYTDDYVMKFMIKYGHKNLHIRHKIILKFVNSYLFYYLKIEWQKIELWKKSLFTDRLISAVDISEERDKENKMEQFSKLLFFTARVENGELKINLKTSPNQTPPSDMHIITTLHKPVFSKVYDLITSSSNSFYTYFKPHKNLITRQEIDLKYSGYIAFISSDMQTPDNGIHIVGLSTLGPPVKPSKKLEYFRSIEAKTRDIRIENIINPVMIETVVSDYISDKLKLDKEVFRIFSPDYSLISDFFVSFDLNLMEVDTKFFFMITSTYSNESVAFEIFKNEEFFMFRITAMMGARRVNYFRRNFNYKKLYKKEPVYVINISKTSDLIRFLIRNTPEAEFFFTFKNFYYIKFSFVLNKNNVSCVKKILFSDTRNFLEQINNENYKKDETKTTCSFENYNKYNLNQCSHFSPKICKIKYCKDCCTKKLYKQNYFKYVQCYNICLKMNFHKVVEL